MRKIDFNITAQRAPTPQSEGEGNCNIINNAPTPHLEGEGSSSSSDIWTPKAPEPPPRIKMTASRAAEVKQQVEDTYKRLVEENKRTDTHKTFMQMYHEAKARTTLTTEQINEKFDQHYQAALRGEKATATTAEALLQATENYNTAINEENACYLNLRGSGRRLFCEGGECGVFLF